MEKMDKTEQAELFEVLKYKVLLRMKKVKDALDKCSYGELQALEMHLDACLIMLRKGE